MVADVNVDEAWHNASMLADINQNIDRVTPMVEHDGTIYFVDSRDGTGAELWKTTDPTLANAELVADINPGEFGSNPEQLTFVGDTLYFTASTKLHGPAIWKTDGTAAGTVMVKDVGPAPWDYPRNMTLLAVGDTLYFTAGDGNYGLSSTVVI